jgi:hypothetical protein
MSEEDARLPVDEMPLAHTYSDDGEKNSYEATKSYFGRRRPTKSELQSRDKPEGYCQCIRMPFVKHAVFTVLD